MDVDVSIANHTNIIKVVKNILKPIKAKKITKNLTKVAKNITKNLPKNTKKQENHVVKLHIKF